MPKPFSSSHERFSVGEPDSDQFCMVELLPWKPTQTCARIAGQSPKHIQRQELFWRPKTFVLLPLREHGPAFIGILRLQQPKQHLVEVTLPNQQSFRVRGKVRCPRELEPREGQFAEDQLPKRLISGWIELLLSSVAPLEDLPDLICRFSASIYQ